MRDIIHTFRVASSPRSNIEDTLKEDDENALEKSAGSAEEAERISKECLSLPIYPHLKNNEIKYICDMIGEFYGF